MPRSRDVLSRAIPLGKVWHGAMLVLLSMMVTCSSAGSGGSEAATPTSGDAPSNQGASCPEGAPSDLLLRSSDAPDGFKLQTPTQLSPSGSQTFTSGAIVAYLKHVHVGFSVASSAVYVYAGPEAASAGLAATQKSQVEFGLLTPVDAPSIGEESYALSQSATGQYIFSWRRCNYLFAINVRSVPSVDEAVALARLVDAASSG